MAREFVCSWDTNGVDFVVEDAPDGGRPEIVWRFHFETTPPMTMMFDMLATEALGQLEEHLGLARSTPAMSFGDGGQEFVWIPPLDR